MKKEKEAVNQQSIKGFKGFDKNFKCRVGESNEMQFTPNSEFTSEGEPIPCKNGIHFCEYPLDVLKYYSANESRFAEVESMGLTAKHDEDSKVATNHIRIKAEINIHTLIKAAVDFTLSRIVKSKEKTNDEEKCLAANKLDRGAATNSGYSGAATNSGDSGAATNSGYRGAATNSGYSGAATNSGDRGAATNSGYRGAAYTHASHASAETIGDKSVAVAIGYQNKVKGALNTWIVIAERNDDNEILSIQSFKVDGINILPDTWYVLKNNKIQKEV